MKAVNIFFKAKNIDRKRCRFGGYLLNKCLREYKKKARKKEKIINELSEGGKRIFIASHFCYLTTLYFSNYNGIQKMSCGSKLTTHLVALGY